MLRAIREIKPTWVIAENVFGITNIDGGMVFEQVCLDLENEGYEVQTYIIPAAAKDAPHRRDRCWFVAYSGSNGRQKSAEYRRTKNKKNNEQPKCTHNNGDATDTEHKGFQRSNRTQKSVLPKSGSFKNDWYNFPTQSPICSGDDGLPTELDGITFPKWRNESIKGYGNAIVPQIAYQLFQIIEHETKNKNP